MVKKISVMHVAQAAGGVDRYLRMLCKYADHNCFDITVAVSQSYDRKNYEGIVDHYETVPMIREITLGKDLEAIIMLRRLIGKYRPDIIYLHSSKAGALGRIAGLGFPGKKIYNPHGWSFNMICGKGKQFCYCLLESTLSHLCSRIVAISEFEKKSALKKHICSPRKIQVVYNGVELEDGRKTNRKSRIELGIPHDAYVIGQVGRLCQQKAPDIFVEAAARIKKKIPEAFFILVGDGEKRQDTEKLIQEKKLEECVLITGWKEDPMEYIVHFDIAVLMSRWEGFGLALGEYMMAGKPVITSGVNAIPEIIRQGRNGELVGDTSDKAAEAAIGLYEDKRKASQYGERNRQEVIARFDVKRTVLETEEIMRELALQKSNV